MNGLKYVREEILKKSLSEVAEQLSVSKQLIYMWESGKKKIPQKRIKQLAELSGIPEKYFLIEGITERDELQIRKHWLDKEINATVVEYDEAVEDSKGNIVAIKRRYLDSGLQEHIRFADMELRILDLLQKISETINGVETEYVNGEAVTTTNDILDSMENKRKAFDRFADVLKKETSIQGISYMLQAMEALEDNNNNRKQNLLKMVGQFVSEAETMVQEISLSDALCAVMLLYQKASEDEARLWD